MHGPARFPASRPASTLVFAFLISGLATTTLHATTLGSATVTDAQHWAYSGSGQGAAANNTRSVIGPFSGLAKTIRVTGTITSSNAATYAKSLRVQPSGAGLAVGQPWLQFSTITPFPLNATMSVDTTVYIPGGFDLSKPINLEAFSIDSEQFVPGIDGRSTLAYTFDDSYAPGAQAFSGVLSESDPTFPKKPRQVESSAASGYGSKFFDARFPHYDVQPFSVGTAGSYALVTANEFESSLVLYKDRFDPTKTTDADLAYVVAAREQTANVLRNTSFNTLPTNDDATGGSVLIATLQPGVQYWMITTALNGSLAQEGDGGPFVGRYSNVISGAGVVTLGLLPEPATLATLATLALAAPAVWRRRR